MSAAERAASTTPDELETARQLIPIQRAGINALQKSGWRPGDSASALVTPIMLGVIAAVGERLPLAELNAAQQSRCRSCDHLVELHHSEGCAYTVAQTAQGRAAGCPCVASPTP